MMQFQNFEFPLQHFSEVMIKCDVHGYLKERFNSLSKRLKKAATTNIDKNSNIDKIIPYG